jgi:hypothetical protein
VQLVRLQLVLVLVLVLVLEAVVLYVFNHLPQVLLPVERAGRVVQRAA